MATSSRAVYTQLDDPELADEEVISDAVHHPIRLAAESMVPDLYRQPPPVKDALQTDTSIIQDETVEICMPFMSRDDAEIGSLNDHGVPHLSRKEHVKFLHNFLGRLPGPFISADASRPWFFYWCLNALSLLGEDVSPYREALVETVRSIQNPSGGFGGGFGQESHLATTYAIVLALTIIGGGDCYEVIDRRAMWRWLCSLKQVDGGFCVAKGGEEDIRGAYCACVVISLLDLPLDLTRESPAWQSGGSNTLLSGVGDYVRSCQTFEGGISAQPGAEAHGGYAFCALGCLSILGSPDQAIPQYLDVPRLIAWLSARQYAPEGGFSGRTNKLVDGCYSHWVGGCWPLIEACLNSPTKPRTATSLPACSQPPFSREGLLRYILCCCQDQTKRGGLRDKPGRPSDAYHSCYVLNGLSSAQNKWELVLPKDQPGMMEGGMPQWVVSPFLDDVQIFDEENRVGTIHPVYTIPEQKVVEIKAYFASKQGF